MLLQDARQPLKQATVAPASASGKKAAPKLSQWESGTYLPSSTELKNHLDRIEKKLGRKVPTEVRNELVRLRRLIAQSVIASADNDRLARRRPAPSANGAPVGEWDVDRLGVHPSISVQDETGLTPYLMRQHDLYLRSQLTDARETKKTSMVVLVGGSCTGKTRTMYEAVATELPDWRLVAPRHDTDLAELLGRGLPRNTIVWLDELQRYLTIREDGVAAVMNLRQRLMAHHRPWPSLIAGTIWPDYLEELRSRPKPTIARTGADVVRDLLDELERDACLIEIPDDFPAEQLPLTVDDSRLQLALDTADTDPVTSRRQITQVLAGGTELVNRLWKHQPPRGFSRGAKAVLKAAADLRRVGLPNPLPLTTIEAAAPDYLDQRRGMPGDWIARAVAEVTSDALGRDHDVYTRGVPALISNPLVGTADQSGVPAYDLHDYLLQDHLLRNRHTPTRDSLWKSLIATASDLDPDTGWRVERSASSRGMYGTAIQLVLPHLLSSSYGHYHDLVASIRGMEDVEALRILTAFGGSPPETELVDLLVKSRNRAGLVALMNEDLMDSLPAKVVEEAGAESFGISTVVSRATYALMDLLVEDGDAAGLQQLIDLDIDDADHALANLLWKNQDYIGLLELRETHDSGYVLARLADVYSELGFANQLQRLPDTTGDNYVTRVRIDQLRKLRDREALMEMLDDYAQLDPDAAYRAPDPLPWLIELLVEQGDKDALIKLHEDHRFEIVERLADICRAQNDEVGLRELATLSSWRRPDEYAMRLWIDLLVDIQDEQGIGNMVECGHEQPLGKVVDERLKKNDVAALLLLRAAGANVTKKQVRSAQDQIAASREQERIHLLHSQRDFIALTRDVHAGVPHAADLLLDLLRSAKQLHVPTELNPSAELVPASFRVDATAVALAIRKDLPPGPLVIGSGPL
jgi:hypothetical protein